MEVMVNVVFVILVVSIIGFIIYRDHKSKNLNLSRKHKGKSQSELYQDKEHSGKLTEAQKGRKKLLLGSGSLLIITTVLFGYIQYTENKQYESYISQVLINDVAQLSTDVVLNNYLLENILSEGEINKTQISAMKEKYAGIHESGRTVVDLADKWLNRIGDVEYSYNNTPFPTYMAYDFHYYLRKLEQNRMTKNETLALTPEDIQTFELMKSINEKWVQAILENIEGTQMPSTDNIVDGNFKEYSTERVITEEYRDTYNQEIVNVDDWANMVEQMQRESEEYETEVENLL